MKKYLLAQNGNFYKANLHCHSTISDGRLSPQELKTEYMKKGYSIIAYTDHDVMVPHFELQDKNFLPLVGYEMEISDNAMKVFGSKKTCHMCLIALDETVDKQVCWHREKYLFGNASLYKDLVKFDESLPDFEREHSPEVINKMFSMAREAGFFVTYNHPAWSAEDFRDYSQYHGMHAMEICNYASCVEGYDDYVPKIYDEILRNGERIYCISADDNHNKAPIDSAYCDSFGGFTMIKAENLEYKTITNALLAGQFYASQGPLIHELYIEDELVTIKCSPASKIYLTAGKRKCLINIAGDKPLTEATFKIQDDFAYFRITVEDEFGKHANTNAYFIDEILGE